MVGLHGTESERTDLRNSTWADTGISVEDEEK